MNPKDVQSIYELLAERVTPRNAREGAAILELGARLVAHFAPKPAAPPNPEAQKSTRGKGGRK
jgi:hypothetical protein